MRSHFGLIPAAIRLPSSIPISGMRDARYRMAGWFPTTD
jgi:hypothetical protein